MSAPTELALLNFRENFEQAAKSIMEAAGQTIFLPQGVEPLPLNRISVAFSVGPASGLMAIKPNGKQEYCEFKGCRLDIEITRERKEEDDQPPSAETLTYLAYQTAKVRVLFQQSERPFAIMPWYIVRRLQPIGEPQAGTDPVRWVDVVSISYELDFVIAPNAWPAVPAG
jgi:hypothetical protein